MKIDKQLFWKTQQMLLIFKNFKFWKVLWNFWKFPNKCFKMQLHIHSYQCDVSELPAPEVFPVSFRSEAADLCSGISSPWPTWRCGGTTAECWGWWMILAVSLCQAIWCSLETWVHRLQQMYELGFLVAVTQLENNPKLSYCYYENPLNYW